MKSSSSRSFIVSSVLAFLLTSCGGGSTEDAPTNTQPVVLDETEETTTWGSGAWGEDEWSDDSNIIITWSSSIWD